MTKKIIMLWFIAAISCLFANAIEIKRYVAEGGIGDGLTKEKPSGNLSAVLNLSKQVDGLTVYLAPGSYKLPAFTDANNRTKYRNVCIYGGGSTTAENAEQKSVITGDLYIDGGFVVNIDFRGSRVGNSVEGYLEGSLSGCNVYYSNASRIELQAYSGTSYLIGVNAETAEVSRYYSGGQRPGVVIKDCIFSKGLGLAVNGMSALIENCQFENCTATALEVNRCEGSVLKNCVFKDNWTAGAVNVIDLTDEYAVHFFDCIFSGNSTTQSDRSSVLTTRSPVFMQNCLVSKNYSDVDAKDAWRNNQYKGAIELTRRQSRFLNCTFYDNKDAVIYYNMEPVDHSKISEQFINCVFFGNHSPYFSEKGNKPVMSYCAADFGSDIPELDAERYHIRIDTNSAKMDVMGRDVFLKEGSCLINAGKPMIINDLYGINHCLLGGTDIGCAEYTGTKWSKTPDNVTINIGTEKYVKMSTTYNGKAYYIMALEKHISVSGIPGLTSALYLGDNLAPVKVLDADNVVAYMTFDGKKTAVLYSRDNNSWRARRMETYTAACPTVVKGANGWIFKAGTAAVATPAKRRLPSTASRARR